jgi:16S rRNA (cytidine1402-2'-O)-methyltransferase
MLSIVSVPIGNLGDITLRALETLKTCAAVACEDTRVTGQLLKHLGLEKKELVSLHGYGDPRRVEGVVERLKLGEHIALVSDAGTPGISDPGYLLVSKARAAGVKVEAVPGAAAFLAALSVSGLPIHHFRYLGFLPLKKGRQTLLKTFAAEEDTIIFYESVHRIERTLCELGEVLAAQPERRIVVGRELTKLHEEVIDMSVATAAETAARLTKKGEFVVMIGPA